MREKQLFFTNIMAEGWPKPIHHQHSDEIADAIAKSNGPKIFSIDRGKMVRVYDVRLVQQMDPGNSLVQIEWTYEVTMEDAFADNKVVSHPWLLFSRTESP